MNATQLVNYFLDYVDAGNLEATRALEKLLQRDLPKKKNSSIHRREVRETLYRENSRKDLAARIAQEVPDLLMQYKEYARRNRSTLSPSELEAAGPADTRATDLMEVAARLRSTIEVIEENYVDAANVDETIKSVLSVSVGGLIAAFHPLLQHPRPLRVRLNGFRGALLTNIGLRGILWDARLRKSAAALPNTVFLTTDNIVDEALLDHVDRDALLKKSDAGAVFLVAPRLSDQVKAERAEHARRGVVALTRSELAGIVEHAAEPEIAVDMLSSLVGAEA